MIDLLFRYPRSLIWVMLIATGIVAVSLYQVVAL